MVEVTVRVPQEIKDVIAGTNETIYVEALKVVARRKMAEVRRHLRKIQKRMDAFESKYRLPYEEFSKNVPDTMNGHDDWIEWSYLAKLTAELTKKTAKLALILGK
jgi:hypothetical protein